MTITSGSSGVGGAIIVDDNHIFPAANKAACETDRDNYFIANPSELILGTYCTLEPADTGTPILQEYRGSGWVDVTAVIQGPAGQDGTTSVDNEAYGVTWDSDVSSAPSRNALYDKIDSMDTAIAANTAKNSYPTADATKVGNISVTQPVDLDQIESDTTTNNAKNSYPAADATKVGHISVTQAVDLDQIESDTAANNAKVSASGSVTSHSDVTDAGSGQIITAVERATLNSALQSVSSDTTLSGDGTSGSPLSVTLPEVTDYVTFTDPTQDTAVAQSVVDGNRGCIITTTTSSNSQTIAAPTDTTAGKQFTVGVSKNSTNTVTVNTTEVQVGQVVDFLWDGTAWINDPTQNTLIGSESTSWVSGCTITINADTTKYDISAGTVIIVDSHTDSTKPVVTTVPFAGVTGVTPTNLLTQPITALGIDVNGNVVEQNDGFIDDEIRDYAVIGSVGHPNLTNITQINSFTTTPNINLASSMNDLGEVLGTINAGGNVVSANGANLNLNVSAGDIFRFGVNSKSNIKNPNKLSASAVSVFPFFYTWQDGVGGFNLSAPTTAVNPSAFDDGTGGAATPNGSVANNRWSIQRVFIERSSGVNAIQYGAATYSTAADAEASLKSEPFNVNPSTRGFVLRAWLIVKGNATDLSDTSQAVFIPAGKFGDESSSGATTSTTTLQSAYNNSVANPEVETNATGGALSIRRGSASDTDFVFEVQNGAGLNVFDVTGEGNISLSAQPHSYGEGLGANTLTLGEAASNVVIAGDLTVNGTTTTINSQTLDVEDKNVTIGDVATPSDITADGGGITLKGATDKTVTWQNSDDSWHFNQGISVDTGGLSVTGDITNTGDVGVGTSTVRTGYKLDVQEAADNGVNIQAGNASADVALSIGSATTPDKVVFRAGGDVESNGGTVTLIETDPVRSQRLIAGADADGGYLKTSWGSGGTDNFSLRDAFDVKTLSVVDGNVGIGEVTPVAGSKLHVNNGDTGSTNVATSFRDVIVENTANAGVTLLTNDASSAGLRLNSPSSSQFGYFVVSGGYDSDLIDIATNKAGMGLSLKTGAFSEAVRIDGDGNVGISKADPSTKLDVVLAGGTGTPTAGTVARFMSNSTTGTAGNIEVISGSNSGSGILLGDSDNADQGTVYYSNTNDSLQLGSNGRYGDVVLDSSGNVLVNSASSSGKFNVKSATNTSIANTGVPAIRIQHDSGLDYNGINFQGAATSDLFFGREPSTDNMILSTTTASPYEIMKWESDGDVFVDSKNFTGLQGSGKFNVHGTKERVCEFYNNSAAAVNTESYVMFSANRDFNGYTNMGTVGFQMINIGGTGFKSDLVLKTADGTVPQERARLSSDGNLSLANGNFTANGPSVNEGGIVQSVSSDGSSNCRMFVTSGLGFMGSTTADTVIQSGGTSQHSRFRGNGDLEVLTDGQGIILSSPNGTAYRITVDNSGNLVTTAV